MVSPPPVVPGLQAVFEQAGEFLLSEASPPPVETEPQGAGRSEAFVQREVKGVSRAPAEWMAARGSEVPYLKPFQKSDQQLFSPGSIPHHSPRTNQQSN